MANRTNRTPTDGTSADRRKERLADPEDSGHFDAALTPDVWAGCPVVKHDLGGRYRCDFAQPHPVDGAHSWVSDDPYDEADGIGRDTTGSLPAVPPQDDVQAADPPATPDVSGETPEPSHTPDVAAGSGGRVGRSLIRPDASEKVLGAAMGVINPVADPAYAIRHAEEQARVLIIGQHWANMLAAVSPPASRLVDDDDVRGVYRKLRQIAATHGIDLDDNGGGQ